MALAEKVKALPEKPGIYLFKNAEGKVIYVGKASSLRKRVFSYFQPARPLSYKLAQLVRETKDLDWIITGSEAEALLFEASHIKEWTPKYNVSLRDDKSYPSLKVTVEEPFPRLFVGRGNEPGVKSIGPYTNATLLREALSAIRRIIPYRTCRTLPKRVCLDYHLKLCPGPCEDKISREDYQESLSRIYRLMEGRKEEVLRELKEKMGIASRERRYEEAARYRDQMAGLSQLVVRPRRYLPSLALADLQSILRLERMPRRIEAFDVSNIFGRQAVGSMITFVDGKPWKAGYKRFKIKTVSGIDDYAMMKEVVRRQYTEKGVRPHFKRGLTPLDLPDLIVIDGGKGHLSSALEVLKELKLDLPAVGIAKEFEELFLPGRKEPILLPPTSQALHVMQRVRDEAHRFAIGYHRLLRGKNALVSALDHIPGIGPRRKQDLLVRFGSVEAIRRASVEELMQVRGIFRMMAIRILQYLKR